MKKLTTELFIINMNKIHNFKYDYSKVKYINQNVKIQIICPIHGEFTQIPINHQKGRGCAKCGKINWIEKKKSNTFEFVKKASTIHEHKYTYQSTIYKNSREQLTVTCPKHGDFSIKANNHMSGKGCRLCAFDYNTFKRKDWIKNGKVGIFYILRCYNEFEEFYKLGITKQTIFKRYNQKEKMPYNYEIIKEIKSKDLGYIWDLEKKFKHKKKKQRYNPLIKFGGSVTECFKNN